LREYITETVKEEYPSLFHEIQGNSESLDSFLKEPDVHFEFPVLSDFFDRGLDSLMKKHHNDLYQSVSLFMNEIHPKFEELNKLTLQKQVNN